MRIVPPLPLLALLSLVSPAPLVAQDRPVAARGLWEVFAADELAELQRRIAADPRLRDSRDDTEQTLLHQAVDRNAKNCAEWLLAGGAAVDATAYNQFTPLHLAASRGFTDCVKLLLKHRPQLDPRSSFGATPLQMAAQNRQRAVVELLRNAGATYDLHTAIVVGDLPWVERCLAAPDAAVPYDSAEAAVRGGNLDIVVLVCPRRAPPAARMPGPPPPSLLYHAIPHAPVVAYLCEHGFDANTPIGWELHEMLPPLHHAAQRDAAATIAVLLAKGADVDRRSTLGKTALLVAAQHASPNALAALLAKGATIDRQGPNLVTLATNGIHAKAEPEEVARRRACAEQLLARDVPVELDAAMALGRLADVDRLLRAAPELATAPAAQPVLVRAAKLGDPAVLARLLAAGADVRAADPNGETALHWSALFASLPCIELLLAREASLTASSVWGFTPLHDAVRSGRPEVAERLLRAGAAADARDREGKRPLDHAPAEQRDAFTKVFAAFAK